MELTSPEIIAKLLAASPFTQPGKSRRCQTAANRERPAKRSSFGPKTRCSCGVCRQCEENKRWERIFAEKFADPEYYSPRLVRFASPLAWD